MLSVEDGAQILQKCTKIQYLSHYLIRSQYLDADFIRLTVNPYRCFSKETSSCKSTQARRALMNRHHDVQHVCTACAAMVTKLSSPV